MREMSLPQAELPGVFIPLPGAPRLSLPVDEVRVSAGFPSPAADYADKRLDINEYLVRNSPLYGGVFTGHNVRHCSPQSGIGDRHG